MIPTPALWVIVALSAGSGDPLAGAELGAAGFLGESAVTYPTQAACQEALNAWQSSDSVIYVCVAGLAGRARRPAFGAFRQDNRNVMKFVTLDTIENATHLLGKLIHEVLGHHGTRIRPGPKMLAI